MTKSILVVGAGPGIGAAVATKFGKEGFAVGLVGRNEAKLKEGVGALKAGGVVEAAAFVADAADGTSVREAVAAAKKQFGGVTVIHWNAPGVGANGDLLTIDPEAVAAVYRVGTVGLLAAIQEALPDMKAASSEGAVLITNGALGDLNSNMDAMALKLGAVGPALANGAKHKLVGLLAARLAEEGVYVAEVVVAGVVKGTASDKGNATLEPSVIAEKFWSLYKSRTELRARVP